MPEYWLVRDRARRVVGASVKNAEHAILSAAEFITSAVMITLLQAHRAQHELPDGYFVDHHREDGALARIPLGVQIKAFRQAKCISLRKLGQRLGVSGVQLGRIERSERNPSDVLLSCLAVELGFITVSPGHYQYIEAVIEPKVKQ